MENFASAAVYSIEKQIEKEFSMFEEEKEIQGSKYMIGHTREYVKVAVPMVENADSKNLTNVILKVEIVGFLGEDILLAK